MFSYRHAFHAGSHADILKHLVLIELIHYLQEKPGAITLAVIPREPSSRANERAIPNKPDLLAA